MRFRGGFALAGLIAVSLLVPACTSGSTPASTPAPVSLPVPKAGEVTFYLSLPASTARLGQAAA